MKTNQKSALLLSALLLLPSGAWAQRVEREYKAKEIEVLGTRPGERTPLTKQSINVKERKNETLAWDLPTFLSGLPSVVVSSDGGLLGGYSEFTIRGVEASRVNITNNGVPLNDGESQTVFWANMPDYTARLRDIVLVRGAGASTWGAGAFGATMDMRTLRPASRLSGQVSSTIGSYGLGRHSIHFDTGRLGGFAFTGALSKTTSKGYVDRSGGDGLSYFLQGGYSGERFTLDLIHSTGIQHTGIAWNGLESEEEKTYGRRFNSAGILNPGAPPAEIRSYQNTDNYSQRHTHLIFRHLLSQEWKWGVTLHHTRGYGYTHEFRTGRRLREYGLLPLTDKSKGSVLRRKYLDNHFYGAIGSLEYTSGNVHLSAGVAANEYKNDHFGRVRLATPEDDLSVAPTQEYYRNASTKRDLSAYLKAEYALTPRTLLYGDLSMRHVSHRMQGPTDRYNSATKAMDVLDYDLHYNFLLPKVGLSHRLSPSFEVYASYAMAGKEPTRKMYTEGFHTDPTTKERIMPRPEYMHDVEVGLHRRGKSYEFHMNLYGMYYKDQIVGTGRYTDVGEPEMTNIPKSLRSGVETSLEWQLTPWLKSRTNATFSYNRVFDYTLYEYSKEGNEEPLFFKSAPLATSPAVIANQSFFIAPMRGLSVVLSGGYVGRSYLDNTGEKGLSLPGYITSSLLSQYSFRYWGEREMKLYVQVNNLLNQSYATKGWGYASHTGSGATLKRTPVVATFPAAPLHVMGGITLHF